MRVTGAGDPFTPHDKTLAGKLPQRKITTTAAEGYSSYGNQIGVPAGYVRELYHPGYVAKRMELGAVIASAKEADVIREKPSAGDVVIALGGRTGRDGVGGATGSSKGHEKDTVTISSAEVQKGDAPEERKIQRLFCKSEVTRLIKKCNDFGAGGVSVAIGELADGLEINLDALPTKYQGLDGTELAISESQERMAVVVAEKDADAFLRHCLDEGIEAVVVAKVTEAPRLVMKWRGQTIVDMARSFIDSAGATRHINAVVNKPIGKPTSENLSRLNTASQKGLAQRFDATVGSGTVFAPYGGKHELTESSVMAALMPALPTKASMLAYGFDPYLSEADPFAGAVDAVVSSVAKLVAAGVDLNTVHLSLQEYFPRVDDIPERWGVVFAAMLGAFEAQNGLKLAAIGGKDSMSGSFGDLHVPPTLVSFACGVGEPETLVSNEFKGTGNPVYALELSKDYGKLREQFAAYGKLVKSGRVLSAQYADNSKTITNMALGNMIGYMGKVDISGAIIFEASEELTTFAELALCTPIGWTTTEQQINSESLEQIRKEHEEPLEGIFPVNAAHSKTAETAPTIADSRHLAVLSPLTRAPMPTAVIPVFPGATGEFDAQHALERAGARVVQVLIRNLTPALLQESVTALEIALKDAQMLIFPGTSAQFAAYSTALFKNPRLKHELDELLARNCLVLRIGAIESAGAMSTNPIDRHQARYVTTRISGVNSPWLSECNVGETYVVPVSSSAGRFSASAGELEQLKANGQIALQFADFDGNASMDIAHNPFGCDLAIAGLTSEGGKILETLVHFERFGDNVAKNITGSNKELPLFVGGVKYFK